MKCNKCGSYNNDKTMFCRECGCRLEAAPEDVTVESAEHNKSQNNATNKGGKKNYSQNTESYLGKAWKDITQTKSWFGKSLLLGLINCVPILNFAATGYAQQWGVDAKRGVNFKMPEGFITNKTFLSGFFELITWIVYSIVWAIASMLITTTLGVVPILGALIGLAVFIAGIFWNSIVSYAALRSAFENELGQAFKINDIFKSWKEGWGTLFACYFVPSIIFKAITFSISLILLIACAGTMLPTLLSVATSTYSSISSGSIISSIYDFVPYLTQFAGNLGVCIVIIIVIAAILGAVEKLLRYRAIGYWVKDFSTDLQ